MTPEEKIHEHRVAVVANAIAFTLEVINGNAVRFEESEGVWLPRTACGELQAARYHLAAERAIAHLDRFDASPRPSLWEGS